MTRTISIDRPDQLAAAVARWQAAPSVALDTEFVRERTFRARLGLVQVAVAGEVALVDAVRINDLSPLGTILGGAGSRKILHSCSEEGMSRELLKLSGSLVHDYATISDDSPSPNRASRARRAATSAGIS